MNVIEIIYQKYPCIKQAVGKSGCNMLNMRDATQVLLASEAWKHYLVNNHETIYKKYKTDFEHHGKIIPVTLKGVHIALILKKTKKALSPDEKNILSRTAKIFQIKGMDPRRVANIDRLCETIVDIVNKGFEPKTYDIFIEEPKLIDIFQNFLTIYLQNTCYLPKSDTSFNENISKGGFMIYSEYNDPEKFPLFEQNIGELYIQSIVQENFKQAFPELYKSNPEPFIYLSSRDIPWENKPEFPPSVILFMVQKNTHIITNFICAKRGPSGTIPERDVYGQLICSNKNIRSSGLGKLLLVSTILMAKQFKVNYIFIQAFQGVAGVQTPLYNRIGFNLHFSNEILKRKTAFHQWNDVTGNEEKTEELYQTFLQTGKLPVDTDRKFQHVLFLKPMWLNVPSYDTRYVCDLIEKPGFDYQTKKVGTMGPYTKLFSIPKRMLGYETQSKPVPEYVQPKVSKQARKRDYEKCKLDEECLSDNCRGGLCIPYNYEETKQPQILAELDEHLKKKGIIENPEYYRSKQEAWFNILAKQDELDLKEKDLENLKNLQKYIKEWDSIMEKKRLDNKLIEEEKVAFMKLYQQYKNATKKDRFSAIASFLLKGMKESLVKTLRG